jgi:hypothetical protein
MRRPFSILSLAVSLVFVSTSALAQKKPKDEKRDEGPSASATWTDPVESEKSDKGPYAPQTDDEGDAAAPKPKGKRAADKGRARDPLQLFGQVVIGFGQAPQESPTFEPGPKGTAIGFQLGGRYDVTPALSAGLRFPITMTMVKDVGGDNLNSTVLGAPELFGEYRVALDRLTSVPILFGVGIPIAAGNPDMTGSDTAGMSQAYANALADATTGWRDSELFQPKRLPIIVGGGVRHERADWELHADLKLVLLPALGTDVANPGLTVPADAGTYKRNAFALREVTTIGGTYNFLDSPLVYAGLDFSLVWTPIKTFEFEPKSGDGAPSSVQAVLEPKVGARFGKVAPSVGYIAPLGGRLGAGDIGGVRLHLDVLL